MGWGGSVLEIAVPPQRPLLVYLDSQDYSRFGDVLRGKSDAKSEALYRSLLDIGATGDAAFAYSMPVLGELLQFDEQYAETTDRKAEAVFELCGGNALAFPSRIVAHEIATTALNLGMAETGPECPSWSTEGYWYPNVESIFVDLKKTMRAQLNDELSAAVLPNRAARRRAKTLGKKLSLADIARNGSQEIGEKYGFAPDIVERSMAHYLEGKISARDASHLLFSAIANPTAFVAAYFRRYEGEKTLPLWMSDFGSTFQRLFEDFRSKLGPHLETPQARTIFRQVFHSGRQAWGANMLALANDDLNEFGIDRSVYDQFAASADLAWNIPACRCVGTLLEAYLLQTSGLGGEAARVEHSFGGDLVHALYIEHCDLWRGDRRFCHLLRSAMPETGEKIVALAGDLPKAIEAKLLQGGQKAGPMIQ